MKTPMDFCDSFSRSDTDFSKISWHQVTGGGRPSSITVPEKHGGIEPPTNSLTITLSHLFEKELHLLLEFKPFPTKDLTPFRFSFFFLFLELLSQVE